MPSEPNSQIKDAVTATNVSICANTPAQAMGNLYQSVAHSAGLAAGNAVIGQQQANVIHQACTTLGTTMLYSLGAAAGGMAANNAGVKK